MTKSIFTVLCLPGLLMAPVALAQDVDNEATEEVRTDKEKSSILTKVKKLKPKFAKLPKSANYLMICKLSAEAEGAEDMLKSLSGETSGLKKEKVALLVLCEDESAKKAAKMLKAAKLKVPTVFTSNLPKGIEDISEYLPDTSDTITFVDTTGNKIFSGDASLAESWKEELQLQKEMKEWDTLQIDEKKYPVAAALKKATTPTFGTFNPKADYFIYLFSASWCGPCKAIMPQIVGTAYPEMLKTRKPKVEIILLGMDQTPEEVGQYRDHYKAKFFAVHHKDPAVRALPGFTSPDGIPHCIIVDKNGNRIHAGHGSSLMNWKTIIENAK